MNEAMNVLLQRRSIRNYKAEQIPEAALQAVLKAGTYAASGGNRQTAVMVVVQDPKTVAELEKMNAGFTPNPDGHPFYGAPTVVIVLADRNAPNNVRDGSLVMGNLMNAAYAAGLGSCWINRAYETFETEAGKALLQRWGVEGDYIGVGNCILGIPDCEHPAAAPRKENYIYYVR